MKKLGILILVMLLGTFMAMAQGNSKSTDNQQHKNAAVNDQNAAEQAKSEGQKDLARLDQSGAIIHQLLGAPDSGIPQDVFADAKCVAVIPSMIKGGFIFGAEYGRGVATCRTAGGWSAPAFFEVTGGSWGAQIGVEGTDLVMLIMNDNGMNQLLGSKFKIGAGVSAAAGPVGREASASTNWKMKSEVLTYSRSRGAFVGATLNGVAIHEDQDAMTSYYGHNVGFRPALTGEVPDPRANDRFLAAVRNAHTESTAEKR
jgi:lipid-binding SYLF domain-containing protein